MWGTTPTSRRNWATAALVFAALLLVGGWPSQRWAHAFGAAYARFANVALVPWTFGHGGHARLQPGDDAMARADDAVVVDTFMVLTVDSRPGRAVLGLSLRRDAYLPLLIVVAVMAAGPLPWRRKLRLGALAFAVQLLITLAAVFLLAASALSSDVPRLYGRLGAALLNLASRTLLSPPGNRFMIPLALGIAVNWWALRKGGGMTPSSNVPCPTGQGR